MVVGRCCSRNCWTDIPLLRQPGGHFGLSEVSVSRPDGIPVSRVRNPARHSQPAEPPIPRGVELQPGHGCRDPRHRGASVLRPFPQECYRLPHDSCGDALLLDSAESLVGAGGTIFNTEARRHRDVWRLASQMPIDYNSFHFVFQTGLLGFVRAAEHPTPSPNLQSCQFCKSCQKTSPQLLRVLCGSA